jgi:hypothetical protein
VHEGVTISHRGNTYAIGSGHGFYGIWLAAAPQAQPIGTWPQTPQGWHDAWYRFAAIEAPDAIVAVRPDDAAASGRRPHRGSPGSGAGGAGRFIAPALIAIGVALGIAGLFPGYLGGASLAQQADELVPHLIYLAAWAASAMLLLVPGSRPPGSATRIGALLGTGVSVVTFGLFFADLGTVISGGSGLAGAGLVLSLLGWLGCATGSVLALALGRAVSVSRPRDRDSVLALLLAGAAALGAAIAFAPSWDSYALRISTGATQSLTAGNSFANPGPVIIGDTAVMIVLVVAIIAAALWQPPRLGAALLAGASIPMVAQAVSAIIQVRAAVSPLQFGFSQAQARQAGLTIAPGLTPAFWIYCAFVVALVLIGARMATTPPPATAGALQAGPVTAGGGAGAAPVPGRTS